MSAGWESLHSLKPSTAACPGCQGHMQGAAFFSLGSTNRNGSAVGAVVCVVWGVRVMQALPLKRVRQKGSLGITGILEQAASSWLEALSSHRLADVTGQAHSPSLSRANSRRESVRCTCLLTRTAQIGTVGRKAQSRGAGCAPAVPVLWIKEALSGLLVGFFHFCLWITSWCIFKGISCAALPEVCLWALRTMGFAFSSGSGLDKEGLLASTSDFLLSASLNHTVNSI